MVALSDNLMFYFNKDREAMMTWWEEPNERLRGNSPHDMWANEMYSVVEMLVSQMLKEQMEKNDDDV